MGREVKRTPIGFDWPLNQTWWGYLLEPVPCKTCNGTGKGSKPVINGFRCSDGEWHTYESEYCPTCEGEGKCWPKVEIPEGPGYQMWENTSEGSPISPVFETPEELAKWLADTGASAFGSDTATYEQWLRVCKGGYAPSAVMTVTNEGAEIKSGVASIED